MKELESPFRSLPPGDPRHGTMNGYNNLGCRCAECREAWRVYRLDLNHRVGRHKSRAEEIALRSEKAKARNPHGTSQRYWLGCRCQACKAAEAAYQRGRRAVRKARVAA